MSKQGATISSQYEVGAFEARNGARVGYGFMSNGLRVSLVHVGLQCAATLEPADALELARAIEREYGGHNE